MQPQKKKGNVYVLRKMRSRAERRRPFLQQVRSAGGKGTSGGKGAFGGRR